MNTVTLEASAAVRRMRFHRMVRKLHVWVGAWGALAAVLFGVSGFLQNHRGMLKLPQGSSTEVSAVEVAVPAEARVSPEALKTWLASSQHLQLEMRGGEGRQARGGGEGGPGAGAQGGGEGGPGARAQGGGEGGPDVRAQGGGSGAGAQGGGERGQARAGELQPGRGAGRVGMGNHWTFQGGNARTTVQAEYVPGAATASIHTSVQSPIAVLERLHKGVGGGVAWILLSDSFAVGMVGLGVSGLIMWGRGRTPKQMAVSILGAATVVLVLVGGSALL